jgi:hypothetical protein
MSTKSRGPLADAGGGVCRFGLAPDSTEIILVGRVDIVLDIEAFLGG